MQIRNGRASADTPGERRRAGTPDRSRSAGPRIERLDRDASGVIVTSLSKPRRRAPCRRPHANPRTSHRYMLRRIGHDLVERRDSWPSVHTLQASISARTCCRRRRRRFTPSSATGAVARLRFQNACAGDRVCFSSVVARMTRRLTVGCLGIENVLTR